MSGLIDAVAMDGPAGAGKSTVARRVAEGLNFTYVDTGAMYRAVTLAAMRAGTELPDPDAMGAVARACELKFDESGQRIFLNGEDVSAEIRTPELTRNIRYAASAAPVRAELVCQQQKIAEARPVVMEGRDITTVVLPQAKWKFFLDASVACRARRRLLDLQAAGREADEAELAREIEDRDRSDYERKVGPLMRTDDQIYLDTSSMSCDEVIDWIVRRVRNG